MKVKEQIISALAAFPALLFAGFLSSCDTEAEGIGGDTGCYMVVSGGVSANGGDITVNGMTASTKGEDEDCTELKKVEVTIFNDGNGNGKQDMGETSVKTSMACSAVGVGSLTTGSFSFNKNGATGGNAYHVEITDANGMSHSFGGDF